MPIDLVVLITNIILLFCLDPLFMTKFEEFDFCREHTRFQDNDSVISLFSDIVLELFVSDFPCKTVSKQSRGIKV